MSGANNEIKIILTLDGNNYIGAITQADGTTKKLAISAEKLNKVLGRSQSKIDSATGSVEDLRDRLDKAQKAFDKLSPSAKNYESALKRVTVLKQHLTKVTTKATGSLGKFGGASGQVGFAILNMNRVISDAPFGLIAISNNIEPLVQSMITLRNTSGGVKGALKVLGSSLIGPLGIMTAVSLVTSAVTYFAVHTRSTAKDVDDLGESLDYVKGVLSEIVEIESPFGKDKFRINRDEISSTIDVLEGFINKLEQTADKTKSNINSSVGGFALYPNMLAAEKQITNELGARIKEQMEIAELTEDELNFNKELLIWFKEQKVQLEGRRRVQEELNRLGITDKNSAKGTINELREKINAVRKLRDETINLTFAQATQFNKEIAGYEDTLALLTGRLSKRKESALINVKPLDVDFGGLTNKQQKLFGQLEKSFKAQGLSWDAGSKAYAYTVTLNLKENRAIAPVPTSLAKVRRAGMDPLKEIKLTNNELLQTQLQADLLVESFEIVGDSIVKAFTGAKVTIGEVLNQITQVIAKLVFAAGIKYALSAAFPSIAPFIGIGARASGGPVNARSPYVIGELGPELFIPNTSGIVVSNKELVDISRKTKERAARLAYAGINERVSGQSIDVNINGMLRANKNKFVIDFDKTAKEVKKSIGIGAVDVYNS